MGHKMDYLAKVVIQVADTLHADVCLGDVK